MIVLFVVYCVFVLRSGYIERHLYVDTSLVATTNQKITVDWKNEAYCEFPTRIYSIVVPYIYI